MYKELNGQIEQAQENIARHKEYKNAVLLLELEKNPIEQKADLLYEKFRKENLDVEKLQKMSFKKAIYTLLSQLVERTEQEKREALSAKIKYDFAKKELDDIQQRIDLHRGAQNKLADCQEEYDSLYNQKKELLMNQSPQMAQILMDKSEQLNKLVFTERSTRKALDYSRQARASLDNAAFFLDKAQAWAAWEGRRGHIIRAIKESYLEDMQGAVFSASRHLRSFNQKLADIGITSDIKITSTYFEADSILSEIFQPACAQYDMDMTLSNIESTKHELSRASSGLHILFDKSHKKSTALKAYMDGVVLDGVTTNK
ncbi:MAG: hypothetical protein HN948_00035 [Clostridia bacterium]|jgi:hypothetical protein|nr:hypothetical protein [Clostridia bacterium]MBT7121375.1 hypothetical protein [Clostridia bacterium]